MANHGARQQKKLAKQKAKRTEKRSQLTRQNSMDAAVRLGGASHWPIEDCLVPDCLWTQGMGMVILSRKLPDGRMAFANYLVDMYCLGIKDANWDICTPADYQGMLDHVRRGTRSMLVAVSPEYVAKLVQDAVEYAKSLGFAPHPDFRAAKLVLGGIDASLCTEQFEFGKDGEPMYIQGPNDSMERACSILSQLGGRGHYVVDMRGFTGLDDDDDDFDDEPE